MSVLTKLDHHDDLKYFLVESDEVSNCRIVPDMHGEVTCFEHLRGYYIVL